METAAELYAAFREDFPRVSEKYFDSYFSHWLWKAQVHCDAEVVEAVHAVFLAEKVRKAEAEYKHRHPEKPNYRMAYNRGQTVAADPMDKGYIASNPVRSARVASKMSIGQFCETVGVSDATLYSWEHYKLPKTDLMRHRAVDMIGNKIGIDIDAAYAQWEAEKPYEYSHSYYEVDTNPKERAAFLRRKYQGIGHALIEIEKTQRQLRLERAFQNKNFRKLMKYPGTPLDEMAILVAKMDRLKNREVSAEIKRLKLIEEGERTKRAIDAIKRDEDLAAEWAAKNKDELGPFKQDWKLYFGVPMIGASADDGKNRTVPSEDYTQMRAVDSTGHLLLEDAILAKIQKEREGYFVKLDYNGRSHGITLLNDDNYVPLYQYEETRPLDDVREARTDKRWLGRGTNGTLNRGARAAPGNVGMMNGHNVGNAGKVWEDMMIADQIKEANRTAARRAEETRVYEIRKRSTVPAPSADHTAPPIELPPEAKVLPEGVDPMDLATIEVDKTGAAVHREADKDWHHRAGRGAGSVHHISRIRLHKRSHAHGKKKGTH